MAGLSFFLDEEALRPRRVARGVEEPDRHAAQRDLIAAFVLHNVALRAAGDLRDALGLELVAVKRDRLTVTWSGSGSLVFTSSTGSSLNIGSASDTFRALTIDVPANQTVTVSDLPAATETLFVTNGVTVTSGTLSSDVPFTFTSKISTAAEIVMFPLSWNCAHPLGGVSLLIRQARRRLRFRVARALPVGCPEESNSKT